MSSNDIWEEVTTTIGYEISKFLYSNFYLQRIAFPCLNHLTRSNYAYKSRDYKDVALCIGPEKVQVYRTNRVNRAAYGNKNDGKTGDVLMLHPDVADNWQDYKSVIVHEATHMIQDYKRLKMTRQEMEMDAHFAQSYYRKKAKAHNDRANSTSLMYYDLAAEKLLGNENYFKTLEFKNDRKKLRSCLVSDYGSKPDFTKKKRQDGIIF